MHIDFLFDFEIDVPVTYTCFHSHQTKRNHVASAFTCIIDQYTNIKLASKSKEYFSCFCREKQFTIMSHDDRVVIVLSFAIIHMKVWLSFCIQLIIIRVNLS